MTKEQQKEIKSVLLGRTVLAEDGRITTLEPGFHLSPGIGDGAGAVRFFGVAKKYRYFNTKLSEGNTYKAARTAMENIGRGLILREQPQTPACLIRYLLSRPVVLTFTYEEGIPTLTGWTGRGLTGWFSLRRSFHAFTDELPDTVTVADIVVEKPPKEKKEKKEKKKKRGAAAETVPEPEVSAEEQSTIPYEAENQPAESYLEETQPSEPYAEQEAGFYEYPADPAPEYYEPQAETEYYDDQADTATASEDDRSL